MAASARLASRTLAFEISTLEWSEKILQAAGLDRTTFPEVRPSGTSIGKVIPEIANRCGLPKDLVVAVGGHDHVCGAIAAGAVRPGILLGAPQRETARDQIVPERSTCLRPDPGVAE